ncbi:MAG TPA: 6-pyruvoyl-tetrahydropterin synthase-related protein [Thermodesulfovibrionales bacterium]|nr:6-pyruvoyl-tetrahydropterin synthase-related protein [Thermodesulfovibrionales bacterium]
MVQRPKQYLILDSAILLAILGLLLTYFKPDLLLSVNTTTGGDTASHYYPAKFMKDYLLPHGRVSGWTFGNYAGFPLFQFYFPLPFVIMALLSYIVPLEIAFKIVSVLGIFLLPVCTYISLRLMRYEFPVPVFGALFALPFLFMEANSMWGGNIPSTLAGEFAFSIGFALSILFIGSLHNGISQKRHAVWNAVLLALVGFSHGYTLLLSVIASSYFLIGNRDFLKKFVYLMKVNSLAFILMGLWIVPLLYYMPYTTHYNFIWKINSFSEVFPMILLPSLVIALLAGAAATGKAYSRLLKRRSTSPEAGNGPSPIIDLDASLTFIWYCVVISGAFYLLAHGINVVDIRFLPFLQFFVCMISGIVAGRLVQPLKLSLLTPVILCLALFLWVTSNSKYIEDWIAWNYNGFENKPQWTQFAETNRYLRGGISDPRVVYEHSSLHNAFGTIRAFESLPLFAGRSTLEGIYMQSTPTSPFVFFIQSEISEEISCPLPDYGCSSRNFTNAIKHLTMFNTRHFIVRSNVVKGELKKYPEFALRESSGPYEVYELTTNEDRYVTPLRYEPVLYETRNWKAVSYKWFKNSALNNVHIAFAESSDGEDLKTFKKIIRGDDLEPLPQTPVDNGCAVKEKISEETIDIKTDCLHRPLLVKVSYHPRWKVEGAKKIYLASPAFMLIFPERENVTMRFSNTRVEYAGNVMSVTGLLVVLLSLPVFRNTSLRTRPALIATRMEEGFRNTGFFKSIANNGTKIMAVIVSTTIILAAVLVAVKRLNYPDRLFSEGLALYSKKNYAEARSVFGRLIRKQPVSTFARDASFLHAISYYLEGDHKRAIEAFKRLVMDFPESSSVAEVYYHMGLSYSGLNDKDRARETFNFLISAHPDKQWAAYAKDRLREMDAQGGAK